MVEPSSVTNAESLEVAKDCLSKAFKIDPLSAASVPKSDSLVQIFSSQTLVGDTDKQDDRTVGVGEDELFGQFFDALEKVNFFGTTPDDEDEEALDKATHLFQSALKEMKESEGAIFDLKNLADTFKLLGNKAMQSKLYLDAIELYSVAIALCNDNVVYYCNRAAAYTRVGQYAEAIHDCNKAIEIDPNYSKAYSRLGYAYYDQGNYADALLKGFAIALQLDPNNESVRENMQLAEQKLMEQQRRIRRGQGSSSFNSGNGRSRSHGTDPTDHLAEVFDLSDITWAMDSAGPSNNHDGEPGIRVGVIERMPGELHEVLTSALRMFREQSERDAEGTQDPHGN
ncbi:uncharacterized protein [Rutidosis leptorrhynchoides]|uniref:uncharacterized protein n=1 Tax=Rutidosis leptorrhynchoides TaxID=125765 RepID=UPI003A9A5921